MNYFCTAGRGTEKFAGEEIISKLAATDVKVVDGKVFFRCDVESHLLISSLKSVERVFVEVLSCREPVNKVVKETVNEVGRYILHKDRWTLPNLKAVVARIRESNITDQEKREQNYPPTKKARLDGEEITFRVSCKCSGRIGRNVQAKQLSRYLGQGLRRMIGWTVDLRNPDVEVSVHLNDEGLTVGIPLQRVPLSKRDYIKHFGLRSTIAWIMTNLLQIQPGDRVVDPMCGKATLLLEASRQHQPCAVYVGFDNHMDQLTGATQNLEYARLQSQVQLLKGDATRLPLKSCSVDRLVTDAPFGQKFIPDADLKVFYRNILTEISRILKPQGRLVLLTSRALCKWLREMFSKRSEQQLGPGMCSDTTSNEPTGCDSTGLRPTDCSLNNDRTAAGGSEISKDDAILQTSAMTSMNHVIVRMNMEESKEERSEQDRALSLLTDIASNSEKSCVCQTSVESEKSDKETVELSDLSAPSPECRSNTDAVSLALGAEAITNIRDSGNRRLIPSKLVSDVESKPVGSSCKHDLSVCGPEKLDDSSGKDMDSLRHKETVNHEMCFDDSNRTDATDRQIQNLNLLENHYVKLGETDAFICIFVKS